MIDMLLLLVFAATLWLVAGEGPWGAGLVFLCTLFSALLAMNFFEPLANLLADQVPSLAPYADLISLVGLFAGLVFLFRAGVDAISATTVEVDGRLYHLGRWGFGALTGYLTMAFLLTALHTAPLPRKFIGFRPERKNLFNMAAPDMQWLGFTQHVSEKVFVARDIFDGPRFTPPGTVQDNTVWPSFPIRYASRREQYARGITAGPVIAPITTSPQNVSQPAVGF